MSHSTTIWPARGLFWIVNTATFGVPRYWVLGIGTDGTGLFSMPRIPEGESTVDPVSTPKIRTQGWERTQGDALVVCRESCPARESVGRLLLPERWLVCLNEHEAR
jgi:hypothetical protein